MGLMEATVGTNILKSIKIFSLLFVCSNIDALPATQCILTHANQCIPFEMEIPLKG